MTWETGTATDHIDLFNKIRDFLTTNADLVAAGENWEQVLGPVGTLTGSDSVTLKGPGLTEADSIYCGMQTVEDAALDIYNLRIWGHSGFSATLAPDEQPNSSAQVYWLLWNQPITYWIMANGRRWMLAAKVSTVYSIGYCGFLLPYAEPQEYPYPMVVAGISGRNERWSTQDARARFFASPGWGTLWCYFPDNVWRHIANYGDDSNSDVRIFGSDPDAEGFMAPLAEYEEDPVDFGTIENTADELAAGMSLCFDGSYLMRDLVITAGAAGPYEAMMGVLDGAYWAPGKANSAENIMTIDAQDYLVMQNLFRTGFRDYMVLRLS